MSFKTSVPILSKEETEKFIKQIDLACRLLDAQVLKWVVEKFDLHKLEDSPEFLEDAVDKLEFWKKKESPVQIKTVGSFETKCIACFFGKKVNGYLVSYYEEKPEGFKVHYERQFAVNFQLKEGQLTDFGWCHAFLYKEEVDQVKQ
ncbi:hypothetical protein [Christiangramia sp.]|uniref:hypothetical protein n=1 Tax=Christiangramia sp. TaxID=1931228 RepID=UPI00262C967E|nr:hypothetical protein [Christiangramia sp.]